MSAERGGGVLPVKLTPGYQGAISQKHWLAAEPFLHISLICCPGQAGAHRLHFLVWEKRPFFTPAQKEVKAICFLRGKKLEDRHTHHNGMKIEWTNYPCFVHRPAAESTKHSGQHTVTKWTAWTVELVGPELLVVSPAPQHHPAVP